MLSSEWMIKDGSFLNTEYSQNRLTKGAEIIKKELEDQVLNDGGNFELSPMYHSIILYRIGNKVSKQVIDKLVLQILL